MAGALALSRSSLRPARGAEVVREETPYRRAEGMWLRELRLRSLRRSETALLGCGAPLPLVWDIDEKKKIEEKKIMEI